MEKLYNFHDIHGNHHPFIKEEIINIVRENKELLNKTIVSRRDYLLDYFGFKTLEKSYLFKVNGNIRNTSRYVVTRITWNPWN